MEAPTQNELASLRTRLANERTLLAYLRTCLGFLATAAAIYRFFTSPQAIAVALGFAVLSVLIMGIGVRSFLRVQHQIRHGSGAN